VEQVFYICHHSSYDHVYRIDPIATYQQERSETSVKKQKGGGHPGRDELRGLACPAGVSPVGLASDAMFGPNQTGALPGIRRPFCVVGFSTTDSTMRRVQDSAR
jgi:hypothetical protein